MLAGLHAFSCKHAIALRASVMVADTSDGPPPMQFVADGVFYAELNELLTRELAEHGYSGVEVRVTPMRTEIIIKATRTQNVLGELLIGQPPGPHNGPHRPPCQTQPATLCMSWRERC